jgi:hypothetical protein
VCQAEQLAHLRGVHEKQDQFVPCVVGNPHSELKVVSPMDRNTVLEHGGKTFVLTQQRRMCLSNTMHPSVPVFSRAKRKSDRVMHTRLAEDRRNPEPLGQESDKFSLEELVSSLKAGKASGPRGWMD